MLNTIPKLYLLLHLTEIRDSGGAAPHYVHGPFPDAPDTQSSQTPSLPPAPGPGSEGKEPGKVVRIPWN